MAQTTDTDAADTPAQECVLLTDAEGTVRWVNPAVDDVFGRSPDPGEHVTSLLGPSAPDPPAPGTAPVTTTLFQDDTELSVTVERLPDTGDVVYRCRLTAPARFNPHRALARVTDAVVELDTDWRYTYVNDAAESLLDHATADLLGEVVWDVFPEAENTHIEWLFERAMATQEQLSAEWDWDRTGQRIEVRAFPSPTGLSVYFRDITERTAREDALRRERDLVEQLLAVSPIGLAVHTLDGRFVRLNERAQTLLGVEPDDLLGEVLVESDWDAYGPDGEAFPDEAFPFNIVRRTGEPTFGTEMAIRHPDEARIWLSVSAAPLTNDAGDIERIVVAFEDITERRAQHEELQRLADLNDLIRGVNRVVVGATDRETIEQAVCDTLVRSERYPAAITTRLTADDRMQVEYAAGLSTGLLSWLRTTGAPCIEPALFRTATEQTPTVLGDLTTDERYHDLLRSTAADCGFTRLQNVPLEHDDTVYGVLTVAAADETAFDDREQAVFVELGQILGTAIEAIQAKKLLHASSVLELELAVGPHNAPLVELTDRLGGTLTLRGVVPTGDGQHLLYADLDGVDPAAIEDIALDGVELVRVIETDPTVVVELRVRSSVAMGVLLDSGGRIHEMTATDGVGQFTVDLTLDTDVRRFLDRVRSHDVHVDLLAKREVDRSPATVWQGAPADTELTSRQRTVLEAAYRSGYFDWPRRRTTGAELAESLDVASSTLHQHLRVATAKVLDRYFGATV